MVEQCTAGCAANGNIPGLTYRSQTVDLFSDGRNKNITTTWRASVSFRHRPHSLKVGYQGSLLGDIALGEPRRRTTCATASTTACRTS